MTVRLMQWIIDQLQYIDREIEGARCVIFGESILLTNYLGVRRSQNFFVSGGMIGLSTSLNRVLKQYFLVL